MEIMIRKITCDKCGTAEEVRIAAPRSIQTFELEYEGKMYKADLCPNCYVQCVHELNNIKDTYKLKEEHIND